MLFVSLKRRAHYLADIELRAGNETPGPCRWVVTRAYSIPHKQTRVAYCFSKTRSLRCRWTTETAGVSTPDLATIKSCVVLLLALVMAALIGHRALSQLRATSRSSFALPAQRSPIRRSHQVSANSHSIAQQHGAFAPQLHRATSSATCAFRLSICFSACLPA